jgi:hypothetical protein
MCRCLVSVGLRVNVGLEVGMVLPVPLVRTETPVWRANKAPLDPKAHPAKQALRGLLAKRVQRGRASKRQP